MHYQHDLRSSVSFAIQDTISGLVLLRACCAFEYVFRVYRTLNIIGPANRIQAQLRMIADCSKCHFS